MRAYKGIPNGYTLLILVEVFEHLAGVVEVEDHADITCDKLDLAVFEDGADVVGAGEGEGLEGGVNDR
ncbi:hypothetical protein [Prosthecobacter sp.]|uniref:hypothetical protein n=1 Tax=Prosthecobacter sp. TaxID=1965333 RepID=UPI0025F75BCE|nr:hypothetical protein [Prosthecobacter sp.]